MPVLQSAAVSERKLSCWHSMCPHAYLSLLWRACRLELAARKLREPAETIGAENCLEQHAAGRGALPSALMRSPVVSHPPDEGFGLHLLAEAGYISGTNQINRPAAPHASFYASGTGALSSPPLQQQQQQQHQHQQPPSVAMNVDLPGYALQPAHGRERSR
jgi:hypothetical protein